jgi:hypothetical protein
MYHRGEKFISLKEENRREGWIIFRSVTKIFILSE